VCELALKRRRGKGHTGHGEGRRSTDLSELPEQVEEGIEEGEGRDGARIRHRTEHRPGPPPTSPGHTSKPPPAHPQASQAPALVAPPRWPPATLLQRGLQGLPLPVCPRAASGHAAGAPLPELAVDSPGSSGEPRLLPVLERLGLLVLLVLRTARVVRLAASGPGSAAPGIPSAGFTLCAARTPPLPLLLLLMAVLSLTPMALRVIVTVSL